MSLQHFILTRFNLSLWDKDKLGRKVRSFEWLEHRFSLFEQFCLPSLRKQSCQDFEWIVLFDSKTPNRYKERILEYQRLCPQMIPVYVEPENGRYFAKIFRNEVIKRLHASRVLTTYLDNDDTLNVRFVEDIQQRVSLLSDGTFISYNDGYQFFTDYKYLMRIHYTRNHFISVVEIGDSTKVRTIFGYGSHYYIDKIEGVMIENIKNQYMWCEVIHDKNMGNDAYFINAMMVKDDSILAKDFGLKEEVKYGIGLYVFRFLPRYISTFVRRCKYYLFGRHW